MSLSLIPTFSPREKGANARFNAKARRRRARINARQITGLTRALPSALGLAARTFERSFRFVPNETEVSLILTEFWIIAAPERRRLRSPREKGQQAVVLCHLNAVGFRAGVF